MDVRAADRAVRDNNAAQDVWVQPSLLYRVSREQLEDRFLRQQEETVLLKQQIHKQDEKIKKLGTKLMRLVKDRGRMESLAAGGATPLRDVGKEEELLEKVRALQAEKETLTRRLLLLKQHLLFSQSQRASPYAHVQPRVDSGAKRRGAQSPPARPRSTRSVDRAVLPRYGHSLLEEARAEIRNLQNELDTQRSHVEELKAELQRKEEEYEDRLQQLQQKQTQTLRSHVDENVVRIKLQKQLAERSNVVSELEERYLHLQEAQQALKLSYDAAMQMVDNLTAELKEERKKATLRTQQQEERICELELEVEDLKERMMSSRALDTSQQQAYERTEQQLRLQISQLETTLKADLEDKNHILDQIKAERDSVVKLLEENRKLQQQLLEQQQRIEELKNLNTEEYDHSEITEALLMVKSRRSQRNPDLGFLKDEENSDVSVRALQAAHAETIQELQKTRNLLSVESQISAGFKAELEAALQQMNSIKAQSEEKLNNQLHLLESRAARISSLEAQLRDVMYGTKSSTFRTDGEAHDGDPDDSVHLEPGENLLELRVESASLSTSALQALGETELSTFSTFCTYAFYLFELHSTPVVTGIHPQYCFTSRYVVRVDEWLLEYLRVERLTVELHKNQGQDWKTLARASIPLRALIEQNTPVKGSTPLVGVGQDCTSMGSLDYWIRMKIPIEGTVTKSFLGSAPSQQSQLIHIRVVSCSVLHAGSSRPVRPYVVYKFFTFPDYPTATALECSSALFNDTQSYPVHMDSDFQFYLESEPLQFYVLDSNEERMDQYVGKARVSLEPLLHNQSVDGSFPLHDASGVAAGHIQVSISWSQNIQTPHKASGEVPYSSVENQQNQEDPQNQEHKQKQDNQESQENLQRPQNFIDASSSKHKHLSKVVLMEKKEGGAKKVTFVEAAEKEAVDEEDDEEESHVSEGQLLPLTSQFTGELIEDDESVALMHSDSDDCIVHSSSVRKPCLRLDVLCLSLKAGSSVSLDPNIVRLFVEFSFLGLQTVETPLSLPKPDPDSTANYNYSKAIPVDAKENTAQRAQLRKALRENNPTSNRVVFTVVSEPPDEQQERDCEDVGVAFIELSELLEKNEDSMEAGLNILSLADRSEVVGVLTVCVEGLRILRSIMDDDDEDYDEDDDDDKCSSSSSHPVT